MMLDLFQATDGGGLMATTTVPIVVTDNNDNTPTCTQYSYAETMNENEATGYGVCVILIKIR